jgi:SAM-dependent methyltransferase
MINPSRFHLERFVTAASASLPAASLVLDAGAGICPYRKHFVSRGHRYESADFGAVEKEYGQLTYQCRLEAIPVEANKYDLVLLSQVLEHIPEPRQVLRELYRVLRPGGSLWLTAPLYYREHEQPYDFYRYTRFGLQHLLTNAGFVIERLEELEGYSATVAHQMALAGRRLPRRPRTYGGGWRGWLTAGVVIPAKPLLRSLARLLAAADTRHRHIAGHCINYCVVSRKPGEPEARSLAA